MLWGTHFCMWMIALIYELFNLWKCEDYWGNGRRGTSSHLEANVGDDFVEMRGKLTVYNWRILQKLRRGKSGILCGSFLVQNRLLIYSGWFFDVFLFLGVKPIGNRIIEFKWKPSISHVFTVSICHGKIVLSLKNVIKSWKL